MDTYHIGSQPLSITLIATILKSKAKLALDNSAREKIQLCRTYLDKKIGDSGKAVYGVNTGFGSLCKVKISDDDLEQLQYNLIRSHACGVGPVIPDEICKILLLLKIQSLSYGNSGVSVETVWRLIDFYNLDILPVIYEQGSLGASGDLCPLSHMSLALIGEGSVKYNGEIRPTAEVLKDFKLSALKLQSKEGLALLNGTQFMSSYAVYNLIKSQNIIHQSNKIAALSLEAYDCKAEPFLPQIHRVRNQSGQITTAKEIMELLSGSETFFAEKQQVQDPYSFRCIPQVHGACRDAIDYCKSIVEKEINGVTDNPNIFVEDDLIVSGGNFHGEPLALTLDFMAMALSELGNIAERRVYRLLSGARNLPEFLTPNPGLNSGLMIPQYTAASIVSQNKQLCTPASVDSISSCNEQEDHVSMGANAATKCLRVVENIEKILAIELLTAAQAFEFRRPLKSSIAIENFYTAYRSVVSFNESDRFLHLDIDKSLLFINA
ncbi:MAG: histidine ammonia-lyase [Bacteroidetes bacterium]|jgi:histidine ammonia-lyase|nr:histidine ammonia-lyase [Bacteroidota bacterium]MBL0279848.1 histidine ammonia-lyase [Bacteroidota bacterium]